VTIGTDGNASFDVTLPALEPIGEFISATATGPSGTSEFSLDLCVQPDHPPVVGSITGPTAPVLTGAPVNLSANFADQDTFETHTAIWNWGDGNTSPGAVTEANGTGSVTGSHTYALSGKYTITLTVTDSDGASGRSTFQVIVPPSILVLDRSASGALSLSGNASIRIPGTIMVDSNSTTAVLASGNATVSTSGLGIVGGDRVLGNASIGHPVTTGAAFVSDPLVGLALPPTGSSQGAVNVSGNRSTTIGPGVYSQISVSGNARLILNPGI